jgi:hypothetical protein
MHFFARNRAGVDCEVGPPGGNSEQTVGRSQGPPFGVERSLQYIPQESIQRYAKVGSVGLGLLEQVRGETESNLAGFHTNKCNAGFMR